MKTRRQNNSYFFITVLYAAMAPVGVITCAFCEVEGGERPLTPRVDEEVGPGTENTYEKALLCTGLNFHTFTYITNIIFI